MRRLLLASSLGLLALPSLTVGPVHGQQRAPCVVERVIDGDTFDCAGGPRVRPIGFDTPERGQGESFRQATAAFERWVAAGDTVELELDIQPTDRYGRQLAWVWRADTLVNERMLAEGWAMLLTLPPNVRYVDRLRDAERSAREARAGFWEGSVFECAPSAFRRKACGQ
ncbi:MAG TPA: thermonuclease family protein [Gemmatimonadales bacterium]|nr:thermonuclease family protein [Gemmatimonadales bacterium]